MSNFKYKVVYLTEKADQVDKLAPILNAKTTKKWFPAYNEKEKIAIVPLQGHLLELAKYPEEYDPAFKKWTPETVFCFPDKFIIKPKERTVSILNRAVEHLQNAEKIIIATDFDNEGAALAMRVIEYAGVEDRVSHMLHMGALDEKSLRKAIKNPKPIPYREMANAGYARAYLDWVEGMSLTRALSVYLAKGRSLVLFGGVKTPLLKMIVDRDLAYESHKKSYFYYLTGIAQAKGKEFTFTVHKKEKIIETDKKGNKKEKTVVTREISSEELAKKIAERIQSKEWAITLFKKSNKEENPPKLYDLTSLQADASSYFGFNPDKVLDICQKLYNNEKIQTYPRTAVRYLADPEYEDVPEILNNLKPFLHSDIIENILKNKIPKRRTVFDSSKVTSHGALAPTLEPLENHYNSLNEDDKKIFDTVATRYIANFMENYLYLNKSGEIELFDGYFIKFSENKPLKAGWKKIYNHNIENEIKNFEETIPSDLKEGDLVTIKKININKGETKPKPRFTLKTLMNAMENISNIYPEDELIKKYLGEHGIGTPATRSEIIKQLLEKPDKEGVEPWLIQKGNQIISTNRAREAVKKIPKEITTPVKRALLNKDLKDIELKHITLEEFLKKYREKVKESIDIIKEYSKDPNNLILPSNKQIKSLGVCPKCKKGHIIEKDKVFLCTEAKFKKDEDGNIINEGCDYMIRKNSLAKLNGSPITAKKVEELLSKGTTLVTLQSPRTGNKYQKYIEIDLKWGIKINFDKNVSKDTKVRNLGLCPKCKKGFIVEKDKVFLCTEAKFKKDKDGNIINEGCDYMIRKNALAKLNGRTITANQVKELLKNKSFEAKLYSKQGKPYKKKVLIDLKWGVKVDFN